jgi:hypothetical protein
VADVLFFFEISILLVLFKNTDYTHVTTSEKRKNDNIYWNGHEVAVLKSRLLKVAETPT